MFAYALNCFFENQGTIFDSFLHTHTHTHTHNLRTHLQLVFPQQTLIMTHARAVFILVRTITCPVFRRLER